MLGLVINIYMQTYMYSRVLAIPQTPKIKTDSYSFSKWFIINLSL